MMFRVVNDRAKLTLKVQSLQHLRNYANFGHIMISHEFACLEIGGKREDDFLMFKQILHFVYYDPLS